jgi:hypothetical protein
MRGLLTDPLKEDRFMLSNRKAGKGLLIRSVVLAGAALIFGGLFGQQPGEGPLSAVELELANLINASRAEAGLPAIPVTVSLTKVARLHVADLNAHRPDTGTDSRGQTCNMHSWSANGDWTPVCYTDDHFYSSLMWNKPREITRIYDDNGYEIAYGGGAAVSPAGALASWKSSTAHFDVILERGIWADCLWQAMGVAIDGKYAVAWFGEDSDPMGAVPSAAPQPALIVSEDHPDPVAAFGGLSLALKKEKYKPGEAVEFIISKKTHGSADLTNSHYRIDIKTDDGWESFFRSGRISYRQGPILESGKGKSYAWDRKNQAGDREAKIGKNYRIKFYAPRTTKDVLSGRFTLVD